MIPDYLKIDWALVGLLVRMLIHSTPVMLFVGWLVVVAGIENQEKIKNFFVYASRALDAALGWVPTHMQPVSVASEVKAKARKAVA